MTDLLASAITATPQPERRVVVASDAHTGPGLVPAVVDGAAVMVVCDTYDTIYPGDALVVEPSRTGCMRIVRNAGWRPSSATVVSWSEGVADVEATCPDVGTCRISAWHPAPATTGATVALLWTDIGPVAIPAAPSAVSPPDSPLPAQVATPAPMSVAEPAPPRTATLTIDAVDSGTLTDVWTPGDLIQGRAGVAMGAWMYGAALDDIAGQPVAEATIRVHRRSAEAGPVGVWLVTHDAKTPDETPHHIDGPYRLGDLQPGRTKDFPLPGEVVSALTSAQAAGLGVAVDTQNAYSRDFAEFVGVGEDITSGQVIIRKATP